MRCREAGWACATRRPASEGEWSGEPGNKPQKQRTSVRRNTIVRPAGRHVAIEEAHAVVERIHVEYEHDVRKILEAFAAKVKVAVDALEKAMAVREDALKELRGR